MEAEGGGDVSDPAAARRTDLRVIFDGADITEDIKPYLLSLSYKDSEEDDSSSPTPLISWFGGLGSCIPAIPR